MEAEPGSVVTVVSEKELTFSMTSQVTSWETALCFSAHHTDKTHSERARDAHGARRTRRARRAGSPRAARSFDFAACVSRFARPGRSLGGRSTSPSPLRRFVRRSVRAAEGARSVRAGARRTRRAAHARGGGGGEPERRAPSELAVRETAVLGFCSFRPSSARAPATSAPLPVTTTGRRHARTTS